MKRSQARSTLSLRRLPGIAAAALCLATPPLAQAQSAAKADAVDKAFERAMTPGEGQKLLDPMIGRFSVKILTWVHPSKPPVESVGSAVSIWVLGNRYVQTMLSSADKDAPFSGIGYAAYDNVAQHYQAAWMDNGSTAITWYTGKLDATGRNAVLKATTLNPVTGKASPLEMRMSMAADGTRITALWGQGLGKTMFKMMELQYTRVGN
jgi:hypothetical protein